MFRLENQERVSTDLSGFEPESEAPEAIERQIYNCENKTIDLKTELDLYLKNLCFSKSWIRYQRRILLAFLRTCNYAIDKSIVINYISDLKQNINLNYARKQILIIRSFIRFLSESGKSEYDFHRIIKVPREIKGSMPKRVTIAEINQALDLFREHRLYPQINAAILLTAYSGIRAEELYQLQKEDIDLDNRILHIRNDANHTVKTGKARIVFFNNRSRKALKEYYAWRETSKTGLNELFGQSHLNRIFIKSELKIKDLRKFFSQEWNRRNGNTEIKEILMGHSLNNSVDLQHYVNMSEVELKEIYDKVMG